MVSNIRYFCCWMAVISIMMLTSGCAFYGRECISVMGKHSCGDLETNGNDEAQANIQPVYTDDGLKTQFSHKKLGHYVEQMVMEMVSNQSLDIVAPLAVASFVNFDSTLNRSTALGNQLTESFIYELQRYHLPVTDYKLTGAIRITPRGDFAFSRDASELSQDLGIAYILSGTLRRYNGGVIVSARIIGVNSKVVVTASESYIPGFVLAALYPHKQQEVE